jgi:hypothetical protein
MHCSALGAIKNALTENKRECAAAWRALLRKMASANLAGLREMPEKK